MIEIKPLYCPLVGVDGAGVLSSTGTVHFCSLLGLPSESPVNLAD